MRAPFGNPLTASLATSPTWLRNTFAIGASFSAYFCMYAFRKPFAVGTFEQPSLFGWDLEFKTTLVISQIIGYALSKFLGARVLPELHERKRTRALISLVTGAWLMLLVFAVGAPPLRVLALFFNGLCLGMIWGLVVSPLEGRRSSELLLAGLSCSFILASGVVKDVGLSLMNDHAVPEAWMPFTTGLVFFPPFLLAAWMLGKLPPPSPEDEKQRGARIRMNAHQRRNFAESYAFPLLLLLASYFLLTAYRDYRDNYGIEIFRALGYASEPALFTRTELPVAVTVLVVLALLSLIRSHRTALLSLFGVMSCGLLLLSGATFLMQAQLISGITWMMLIGLGSYLTYVPFGSVLFDRIIAHTRFAGTAVFGIYLADAVGYSGSVLIQVLSEWGSSGGTRLEFFLQFTHFMAWVGAGLLGLSGLLWLRATAAPHLPPKPRVTNI